jgi:hypothetical protein
MSSLLKKLEDNRTAILLAEIGAYLHDLGKARKEFVEHYAENGGSGWDGHNFPSKLSNNLKELLEKIKVEICNEHASLLDFIEKHHKEKEGDGYLSDCDVPSLIRLLYAGWNGYDGMDSGLDKGSAQTKQKKDSIFISTAFGHEPTKNKMENNLIDKLGNEIINHVIEALQRYTQDSDVVKLRRDILKNTKGCYLKFLGETRRPANDVTLWDHSYSVASLYKCAIVKNIIDCSRASFDPLDFRWNILSINLSVLSVLAKSIKIGDVLGYKEKIDEAFREIKTLIELTYPIGNEIYQDTTGIYFIIPDIEVGELKEEIFKKLKEIEPEFMAEIMIKEMQPIKVNNYKFNCINQTQIASDINSQRRNLENVLKENLKRILPESRNDALKEIPYPTSNNRLPLDKFIGENWDNKEVCPICRFRPMKENSGGCEHCLERRKRRAKNWIEQHPRQTICTGNYVHLFCNEIEQHPRQTIWLDEVSDHNDRVALLIGSFILDKWLDGTLVKTFAINKTLKSKNPSPARIRRCWETTQEFIQTTIFKSILDNYPFGANTPFNELRRKRIQITIDPNPGISVGATLDIDIDGVRLSPVCVNENKGIFITETNLQILANKGKTLNEIALWMQGKNIKIKRENDNKWQEGYKISMAKPADDRFQDYIPYIKIYEYPDEFMVLVPAYDAFDIAKKILEEYEIQFSKVRDRLPFHIGIIGFHRRTPLYVAMDASKRLIETFKNKTKTINAKIDSIDDVSNNELGKYVRRLKLNPDPCYSSVPIIWHISYSTGDPNQQDEWHPYIRFNGNNPNRGNYSFDYTGNGDYVVHVKELKVNDCIKIETSYFKLSFLENASDRFRIDDDLRPLDDIKRLEDIWNEIQNIVKSKKLGISQLYAYWEEVKKRYEDYGVNSVWENFVKSSLINILKLSPEEDKEVFNKLFHATKDGLLDICLYWSLQVRKVKPEKA